jgi:hypothetical protein
LYAKRRKAKERSTLLFCVGLYLRIYVAKRTLGELTCVLACLLSVFTDLQVADFVGQSLPAFFQPSQKNKFLNFPKAPPSTLLHTVVPRASKLPPKL